MAIFKDDQKAAAWYAHLRVFESDFDKSQSQMRAICTAWSTAVLAAIALIITTAATPIVVNHLAHLMPIDIIGTRTQALAYLRTIVCGIGSAGVLAFWYIDQGVYQRLLHSVFAYGMFIESEETELPQIRSSMFLANLDVTNQLGTFYRAQFWTFAVLSMLINVLSVLIGATPLPGEVWVLSGLHLLAVLFWEVRSYHTWPALDANLRDFYPKLAQTLPQRPKNPGLYHSLMDGLGMVFGVYDPPSQRSRFDDDLDPKLHQLLKRLRHGK